MSSPLPRLRANVLEAWAVWLAIDTGLFDRLKIPSTVTELQLSTGFNHSALLALLGALVTTGHVTRDGEQFVVSDASSSFVCRSENGDEPPQFIGRSFGFLRTAKHFESYPKILRDGGGVQLSAADWAHVTLGSSAYVPPAVEAMVQHVGMLTTDSAKVLDVGCGNGDYTMQLTARLPGIEVVAIDPTVAVAAATSRRLAGCERATVRCCHLNEVDEHFDVLLVNHVVHVIGADASRQLLAQALQRLKPGGQLVIQELVTTEQNRGELFGLMMRLLFPDGRVFALEELETMATDAGFQVTAVHALGPGPAGLRLLICESPKGH